jgi:hypothetical protein
MQLIYAFQTTVNLIHCTAHIYNFLFHTDVALPRILYRSPINWNKVNKPDFSLTIFVKEFLP